MAKAAKAYAALIIAAVSTGLTAVLALIPPHTTTWIIIVGVVAFLGTIGTGLGVYAIPNTKQP